MNARPCAIRVNGSDIERLHPFPEQAETLLARWPTITDVTVSAARTARARAFVELIATTLPRLERLDITGCSRVNTDLLTTITTRHGATLRELRVAGTNVDSALPIANAPKLEELDLSDTFAAVRLSTVRDHAERVTAACTALRDLNVSDPSFGGSVYVMSGHDYLLSAVCSRLSRLTALNLSANLSAGTMLGDWHAATAATLANLQTLNLAGTNVQYFGQFGESVGGASVCR